MKKSFKYLLLALLIIPCALVFTACGNTAVSKKEFGKFIYEQNSDFIAAQDYATWENITFVAQEEMVTNTLNQSELPRTDKIQNQIEITRVGNGEDTVIRILVINKTDTTETTLKPDETKTTTQTITRQDESYTIGKMGPDKQLAVYHYIKYYDTEKTVDGAKQEPVEAEPMLKEYNILSAEEFQNLVERVTDFYTDYNEQASMFATYASLLDGEVTKNGTKITAKMQRSMLDLENLGLTDASTTINYTGKKLSKVSVDMSSKIYRDAEHEDNNSLKGTATFAYGKSEVIAVENTFTGIEENEQLTADNVGTALDTLLQLYMFEGASL